MHSQSTAAVISAVLCTHLCSDTPLKNARADRSKPLKTGPAEEPRKKRKYTKRQKVLPPPQPLAAEEPAAAALEPPPSPPLAATGLRLSVPLNDVLNADSPTSGLESAPLHQLHSLHMCVFPISISVPSVSVLTSSLQDAHCIAMTYLTGRDGRSTSPVREDAGLAVGLFRLPSSPRANAYLYEEFS